MLRSGNLWETPFVELLRLALETRATGRIDLTGAQVKRRILLRDGVPVRARSNLLSENLYRYLLRRGLIDRTVYAELLSESSAADRRRALLERRLLPSAAIEEADTALSAEIIMACLGWTEGSFTWTPLGPEQIEHATEINPFELYVRWLREQVAIDRVIGEAMRYRARRYGLTITGQTFRRFLGRLLEESAELSRGLAERWTVQQLLDASAERLDTAVVAFNALLHLGAVQLAGSVESGNDLQQPPPASRGDLPAVRQPETGDGRSRLERVNKLVESELARVRAATTPHEVLDIASTATLHEAQETYRRLEEYYRPDNFKVLGDQSLLERVVELRDALHAALKEVIRQPPISRPLPRSVSAMRARRITRGCRLPGEGREGDGAKLAQLLHQDGETFLRIGDYEEAADQFRQAHNHSESTPVHLAFYGWAVYLGGADEVERARGREALQEALRRAPGLDAGHVLLGNLLSREGDMPGAAEAFRQALECNPDNREARAALDILA